MPQGAMGNPGAGMNQAGGMCPGGGMMDQDGKGSRVAALSRSSQPKQGAGGWHGADRRSGRPPPSAADVQAGGAPQQMPGTPGAQSGSVGAMPDGGQAAGSKLANR